MKLLQNTTNVVILQIELRSEIELAQSYTVSTRTMSNISSAAPLLADALKCVVERTVSLCVADLAAG